MALALASLAVTGCTTPGDSGSSTGSSGSSTTSTGGY
jgi:hypothetical protein